MSIATEIARLQTAKADIKTAIEAKGVTVSSEATIDTYDDYIASISTGSTGWQPNPTWWDIDTILANDTESYPKNIFLITDEDDVTDINVGGSIAAVKTSDGSFYTLGTIPSTHTWDKSYDLQCQINGVNMYKTRYIIYYYTQLVSSQTLPFKNTVLSCIIGAWISFSASNTAYCFYSSVTDNNSMLSCESIKITAPNVSRIKGESGYKPFPLSLLNLEITNANITYSSTGANVEFMLNGISKIQNINIQGSLSEVAGSGFISLMDNLRTISLPNTITTIKEGNGILFETENQSISVKTMFPNLVSIGSGTNTSFYRNKILEFPSTFTTLSNPALFNYYFIIYVKLFTDWDITITLNLANLTPANMVEMFNYLKDNTALTAKTLTLGSTNLAKLTAAEQAIATDKNWILA